MDTIFEATDRRTYADGFTDGARYRADREAAGLSLAEPAATPQTAARHAKAARKVRAEALVSLAAYIVDGWHPATMGDVSTLVPGAAEPDEGE
jgi:hypothetical protein